MIPKGRNSDLNSRDIHSYWKKIFSSYLGKRILRALNSLRAEYHSASHGDGNRGDSETQRECDLHRAVITQDQELFSHVYAGTPLPSYRARMLRFFPKASGVGPVASWSTPTEKHFNLNFGRDVQSGIEVKAGPSTHRLIWELCCDFYRQLPVGSLFHLLFPNEYYDPDTSRDRVQAIIYRARGWLMEHDIPMAVNVSNVATGGAKK